MREIEPGDDGAGLRVVIVASKWNEAVVRRLVDGALATLRSRGVRDADVELRWVPGAFELPLAAQWAAGAACDAVVALGCVIRGETRHFRIVADECARGLMQVGLATGVPVLDGVLAVENAAQADARTGGEHGNAGAQAALAAIRMAHLRRRSEGR